MRKLFWVCWCFLLLAFVGSYFRATAFDYQLTRKIWLQAAISDGGVRFIAVCGDPSASWTANTVIERDKNTWRNLLFTAPWGRVAYSQSPVDTLGTMVGTYRIGVPLLGPLLIPLAFMLAAWSLKRWWAPPRLVWAELWTTPLLGRGFFGIARRSLLAVSILFTLGAALLWAGSYLDPLPGWRYFGNHFAFVMGKEDFDLGEFLDAGQDTVISRLNELRDERNAELGQPQKYFSIEIIRERVALRYYTADVPAGSAVSPTPRKFGGFEFSQVRNVLPIVASPFPRFSRFGSIPSFPSTFVPGSGSTAGLERIVILPLWALVILFGLWPMSCFIRGPLRRARRRAAGCCPPCGYNLTGLIEPRCPECGTAFDPEQASMGIVSASRSAT